MKTLTKVEQDYLDGKWVPSYYGQRFAVARKTPGPASDIDPAFRCVTFEESREEADMRNAH